MCDTYYMWGMWKGDQNDKWRLEDELRGALLAISQMQGESGCSGCAAKFRSNLEGG